VLIAPAVFSMVWFSVLGGTALDTERETDGAIGEIAQNDEAMGAFTFVDQFPLAALAAGIVILLVWVFFVTGADSGTVVLGSLSSRGTLNPPSSTKLIWGAIMASVAATLLIVDELDALQNGAIAAAGPFGLLMLLICVSLVRCLGTDERERRRAAHGDGGDRDG
jgi:glycine betaine transporter